LQYYILYQEADVAVKAKKGKLGKTKPVRATIVEDSSDWN